METRGARNHTNHRVGAWHGRAKYPTETIQRARALRDEGKTYAEIGRELGVPWRTVTDWVTMATRWAG